MKTALIALIAFPLATGSIMWAESKSPAKAQISELQTKINQAAASCFHLGISLEKYRQAVTRSDDAAVYAAYNTFAQHSARICHANEEAD